MKKKIIIAAATMFLLALLFPISAFAATHDDVDTWAELADAFTNDTDEQVTINLTGDIAFENNLTANAGRKYTISGTDYKLYDADFSGEGTVEIYADIEEDSNSEALITYGLVDVTVTGDITAEYCGIEAYDASKVTVTGDVTATESYSFGIYACETSTVTVTGVVSGEQYAIYADGETGSSVTVNGDVYGGSNSYYTPAIYASNYSNVTITGKVASVYWGVGTYGAATVTVNGNVESNQWGVGSCETSTITVYGNINADYYGAVYAEDTSNITVTGNLNGYYGICCEGSPVITVTGNITGTGYGIYTNPDSDSPVITVNGSVYGENGNPDDVNMSDPYSYSSGKPAVYVYYNAIVHITGDAIGGKGYGTSGYGGSGVEAYYGANVTVDGNVVGGDVVADPETQHADDCESHAGDGVSVTQDAIVNVGGDVKGGSTNAEGGISGAGIDLWLGYGDGEAGSVTVQGNVAGGTGGTGGEDGEAIYLETTGEDVPVITVYSLTPGGTADLIGGNYEEYETMETVVEALKADINFFIRTAPAENGTVTADKETAKTDEVVTFTLTSNEGYKADSAKVGETALTITARAGVYTYVVPENGFVTGIGTFVVDENYVPNTGDSTNLVLYIALGFAALMAMAAVVVLKKKEN